MRSKRQGKETSFGDDFYTYIVEKDATSFIEPTSAPDANIRIKPLGLKLNQLRKIILGP